ncbi:LD-carboxypeptidase [Alkaliphilus sp. MSJ-5]|uniref:LD-carboxypeptidase n=1 Tax=Alkaliphilus flagellatus TaxID=2841507 RepID=A0ABS6G0P4_9FIRM|nr:S66 peptidase family protein [Alkaliphilus flagellatus]MBU5675769.1 LD-carboxypeptidase [Alkaliphilus flagellatus]
MKIKYPTSLKPDSLIGVTAPSSGVEETLHILVDEAKLQVEKKGFKVLIGETVLTQHKGRSASKEKRVEELMDFLQDHSISVIMPPWGGSFAMEILPFIDWDKLKELNPKWILGYSDISTLIFAYTTITGHASAHGVNFTELSAPEWDGLSSMWIDVLSCNENEEITQYSSEKYQSSWDKVYSNPAKGFYLDSQTEWKTLNKEDEVTFSGRLIGGCVNSLQVLVGTPFDNVNNFVNQYCHEEGVIWYLETVGMDAAEIYRALWQMKQNHWFSNIKGVLFGRTSGYKDIGDFTLTDALKDVFESFNIPVILDADVGHTPPQNILVNGAYTTVKYSNGKGSIIMKYI